MLVRYYRRIALAMQDADYVGDRLSAEALEDLWKSMFSRHEQRS